MASYVGATILVVGFVVLLKIFSLLEKSREVVEVAKSALLVVQDSNMDDADKETAMQGYSKTLAKLFIILTAGAASALLLPAGVVWLLGQTGIISFDDVIATTLSWQFLLGSTVLGSALIFVVRKR